MENKPKKSKALIITIIALILLLIVGYLIFKNRDVFGVKTSASIAKIFSPLISSTNSKNLTTVQAGEDIKKGNNVSVFGTGTNNIPIVMKTTGSNSVFGSAYEDINSGNTGQINPNTKPNSFFNSFSNFLGGMFSKKNQGGALPSGNLCPNGATNPPNCTTIGNKCINGKTNPPDCTNLGGDPDLIAGIVTPTNSLPTGGDLALGDTTPPGGGITPPASSPVNACLDIEQNPLTFTPEEKARLAVLLRQFYLISSTLDTTEDITTIYNEIDQQKNFISQIQDLTNQCYKEVTPKMMTAEKWVRHGNPWYTPTTGGIFPYTDQKTGSGYLDYSQLEGGQTPAGFKVISGYYYGTLTKDFLVVTGSTSYFGMFESSTHAKIGSVGDSCDMFNNFDGYGLSNQINNDPNIYTGTYKGSGDWLEANSGGYPGDSLVKYNVERNNVEQNQPEQKILDSGCSWKDGVILDNTERILNIW